MEWRPLPADALVRRLETPRGRISMVLDTDTYNEVDDQFALSYALLSPEKLSVEAVCAAPFWNSRSEGPEDGMEKSYNEIIRLLGMLHRSADGFAFRGSRRYLPDADTPVDSPAARTIAAKALAHSADDPLTIVAIGAATNVASALLMHPEITDRVAIVWLGGHPLDWPTAYEFNLKQDVPAARVLFDCGAPLTLVPCKGVASNLLATVPDLQAYIGGKNPLCDALVTLFAAYEKDPCGWAKEIWDVAVIAYLIEPDWVPSCLAPSPLLTDDCRWGRDARRHPIRVAYFCKRTPIFRDMYAKLANAPL